MLPENRSFIVRGEDGQEYGPVDLDELREWVQENRAGLGTDVRPDEPDADWHPWQNYPELVALLSEAVAGQSLPAIAVAPLRRRIVALIADLLFLWVLFIPIVSVMQLFMPLEMLSQVSMDPAALQALPEKTLNQVLAFQLACDGVVALYLTGFVAAHGQTPGKGVMRLRVVMENGRKPTLLCAFVRAVVWIISAGLLFLPFTLALFNPHRRALHDYLAGTYVVDA